MASKYTTVPVEKPIHKRLKLKLRNTGTTTVELVTRLIEMYLDGDIAVVIPPRKV